MSRHVIDRKDGMEVAYGFDKVCGYFFQLFDKGGDVIEDLDCLTHSRGDVLTKFDQYGVPDEHMEMIALDLPF